MHQKHHPPPPAPLPIIQSSMFVWSTLGYNVFIFFRLLEGHIFDPNLTLEAAEALCVRGTVRTEGGYQFSRDLRLKEVICSSTTYNFGLYVYIPILHVFQYHLATTFVYT